MVLEPNGDEAPNQEDTLLRENALHQPASRHIDQETKVPLPTVMTIPVV